MDVPFEQREEVPALRPRPDNGSLAARIAQSVLDGHVSGNKGAKSGDIVGDVRNTDVETEDGNVGPTTKDGQLTKTCGMSLLPVKKSTSKSKKPSALEARNPSTRSRNPSAKLVASVADTPPVKKSRAPRKPAAQKEPKPKRKAEGAVERPNKRKKA